MTRAQAKNDDQPQPHPRPQTWLAVGGYLPQIPEVGTDAKATGEHKEKDLSFFHTRSRSVRRGARWEQLTLYPLEPMLDLLFE